jgi:hypothetical protein
MFEDMDVEDDTVECPVFVQITSAMVVLTSQ